MVQSITMTKDIPNPMLILTKGSVHLTLKKHYIQVMCNKFGYTSH